MGSPLPGVPLRYRAVSASDSVDATEDFPGAMAILKNLVPLPAQKNYWICRPAMAELTAFATFTTPDFISALLVVGDIAYGMIKSQRFPGFDEPFSYNLSGGTFNAVATVTALNTPSSLLATGAWTPPTMALVGTKIIVTHPGFSGVGANFFGVIDVANPAAPAWSSQNTVTNALPVVPTAVANFNGRAWYLVNPPTGQPGAYYSDVLVPGTITNASQVLTFDDNVPLTACAGLPLNSQLGGVVQSLIVFKGVTNLYQVTGDAATGDLRKDALNKATGTYATNSITPTPYGLAFASPEGMRIIDFTAAVSDPIGVGGDGVVVPFAYANTPSRICAAANASVIRITTQNDNVVGSPYQEWWYDMARKIWSGPHTSAASLIERWGNTFVVAPQAQLHSLARSDVIPSSGTTFTEYGTPLTWEYQTAFLPDPGDMCEISMVETTLNCAFDSSTPSITAAFLDQDDAVIDSVVMAITGAATLWGSFVWGASPWGGALTKLRQKQIPWSAPIVFRRGKLDVTGDSSSGVILGDMFFRYQLLGYLQQNL